MQASAWMALLRLVPPAHHNNLMLTIANGTEMAVNSIVRAEKEYLVIRGRLTGTTEGGGFFFVPFDQIKYLGFQRPGKEAEVRAMDGEGVRRNPPRPDAPPA